MKKKYDEAKERLENDVKDITELMKVRFIIFLRVLLLLDTVFLYTEKIYIHRI